MRLMAYASRVIVYKQTRLSYSYGAKAGLAGTSTMARRLSRTKDRGRVMTARTVRRVLRPQNLAAILGLGVLAVAFVGALPGVASMSFELLGAAVGIASGATVVAMKGS